MADPEEKNEYLSTFHIGMHKGKSLLAIFIGFIIWQLIRLIFPDLEVHPVFVYMYALLEIRDTSDKTRTFGLQRIKATFVAMLIGLPLLLLRVQIHTGLANPTWVMMLDLMIILAGVLLTLQLGQKFGCGNLTGLAAAIFIILLIYHADDNRYLSAVLRAFQTVIGVFVAWLVNVVLLPYPRKKKSTEETQ